MSWWVPFKDVIEETICAHNAPDIRTAVRYCMMYMNNFDCIRYVKRTCNLVLSFWSTHLPPLHCMYADIGMPRPRRGNAGAGVFAPMTEAEDWSHRAPGFPIKYATSICRWTWAMPTTEWHIFFPKFLRCPKLVAVKVPLLTLFFCRFMFFWVFYGKIVTCFLLSCIFHRVSLGTPPVCHHSGRPQVSNDVPSGLPARDAQGSMWAVSCVCVVSICFPEFHSYSILQKFLFCNLKNLEHFDFSFKEGFGKRQIINHPARTMRPRTPRGWEQRDNAS